MSYKSMIDYNQTKDKAKMLELQVSMSFRTWVLIFVGKSICSLKSIRKTAIDGRSKK
ncbi:hypothetical protein LEP1GSC107_0770 [Leptospira interrogans serovar Grippotyphosa str. UI 12769]|uniref:Uncharacterized protein n=3 Tax=Leptospira interrogans TaxID=173 RepID=M6GP43_LEPIR|nr:hypothetical protein LEP1GSC037_0416 [Leptospira interrogans str. 2006001854]EMN83329.1 hypothetical protein LEP1GSC107_0770 [Leptospira interrogans serovar Grippotyphosa str. UI 12769]